ncbi:MAG: hypothetical protein Q8O24_01255 [Gallionellaceae bacterium]|nr:hypothetical protein [Gallionellaceae bacterium]
MALKSIDDCCADAECKATHPKKQICPSCGGEHTEVSARTIAHHIKQSWQWGEHAQKYFFCDNPHCDVVYFGENNITILMPQLRTKVGIKERSDEALLCYCFGVTRTDVMNDPCIKDFVVEKTKQKICSCETSNPSGRCCLKQFPNNPDIQ